MEHLLYFCLCVFEKKMTRAMTKCLGQTTEKMNIREKRVFIVVANCWIYSDGLAALN